MKLAIALTLALLAGCAQYGAVKGGIVDQASQISDEALASSQLMLCRGITVGAWTRAYGNDAAKAAAWRTLCAQTITQLPAAP